MIVEFTGPTGVGKSSCLEHTVRLLELAGVNVGVVGHSTNSMQGIPRVFAFMEGHNWKTDAVALLWAIALLLAHPRYAWFVLRGIFASDTHYVAITRAVLRKIGIHRFLSRPRFKDRIILVDEGIVHVSHNILVPSSGDESIHAYLEFARLTPIPSMLIFLDAPEDVLVQRLNSRGDLSPRIRSEHDLDVFVRDARCLFSVVAPALLRRTPAIQINTTEMGNEVIGRIVAAKINEILCINGENQSSGVIL